LTLTIETRRLSTIQRTNARTISKKLFTFLPPPLNALSNLRSSPYWIRGKSTNLSENLKNPWFNSVGCGPSGFVSSWNFSHRASHTRKAFPPGLVRAEASAKSPQPAGRASAPFRNFRTHHAPDISLTSAIRASHRPNACLSTHPGDGPRLTRLVEVRSSHPRAAPSISPLPTLSPDLAPPLTLP
jgi:hypothetical protein